MGLLSDIYSTADTAKRRLSGLLADPLGTLALGVTRFGEDQAGLLNMAQNAYPMAGNKTVLNTPEQLAQFRQQVADQGAQQAMSAATVWHGSPHKFDKFDSNKIGTGEGAQAYGHGLYLAESPAVAREYQEKLSSVGGAKNLAAQYGDVDKGIAETQRRIASYKQLIADGGGGAMDRAQSMLRLSEKNLQDLTAMKAGLPENTGALYKVDLPDEHIAKMLDYDKPLSQQHPDVRSAVQKIAALPEFRNGMLGEAVQPFEMGSTTGQTVQNLLSKYFEGNNDKASGVLQRAGITGIRYLDGGSRGAGAGSSNFVVFPGNEGLLSILERNGQALK